MMTETRIVFVRPTADLPVRVKVAAARTATGAAESDWARVTIPSEGDVEVDFYETHEAASVGDTSSATHRATVDGDDVASVVE